MQTLLKDWFHTSGMSPGAKAEFGDMEALSREVGLLREVSEELEKWKRINKRKRKSDQFRTDLCSEQIVLLLEYLLELPNLSKRTLISLHGHYALSGQNADVLH